MEIFVLAANGMGNLSLSYFLSALVVSSNYSTKVGLFL